MHIGVDVDEVLAEFTTGFLEYHNQVYGTQLSLGHCTQPDLHRTLGETPDVTWQRMLDYWETSAFDEIHPVDGSLEAIHFLKKYHALEVVSNRHSGLRKKTEAWLHKHYSDSFSAIHLNGTTSSLNISSKLKVCEERNLDLLIEDLLHNAQQCATEGRTVYLLNKPWNQCSHLPPNIIRVSHWEEIVRVLT